MPWYCISWIKKEFNWLLKIAVKGCGHEGDTCIPKYGMVDESPS